MVQAIARTEPTEVSHEASDDQTAAGANKLPIKEFEDMSLIYPAVPER